MRFSDFDPQVKILFAVTAVLFVSSIGLVGWATWWLVYGFVRGL